MGRKYTMGKNIHKNIMQSQTDDYLVLDLAKQLTYKFKHLDYLRQALIHSSYRFEIINKGRDKKDINNHESSDNERFEFLGDRVLGLAIATILFERYPLETEGQLARRYNSLVNHDICTKIARDLRLQAYIRVGPSVNQKHLTSMNNILANTMEALIAAIYKDSDFQSAKEFIECMWKDYINTLTDETPIDAKSKLQEWYQQNALPLPRYKAEQCGGSAHDPVFKVVLCVEDEKKIFEAQGKSKREAQQKVAQLLLVHKGLVI